MQVPLTIRDHLDRAELVYGDRTAIIDEHDQPAQPLGGLTYRAVAERSRSLGAGPGIARVSTWASGWRSCRTTRRGC